MPLRALSIVCLFVASAIPVYADSFTGIWSWAGKNESGGWLKVMHSNDKVKFQKELARGGPLHSSGYVEGEFALKGNKGTFKSKEFVGCEITFEFQKSRALLNQKAGQNTCGFGHGVGASGIYNLKSSINPLFSISDPTKGQ